MTEFKSLQLAENFANRCEKLHLIILGDNNRYWVALPKVTEKLNKQGYEYAN